LIISTREHLRGQILVVFALASVALFAIVALAIDGARMLVEQRGLQNGVDGAALTGALDLGPGAGSVQTSWALDDTVYAVERTLGIDFSNNYAAPSPYNVGHRLLGGATACSPNACTSSTSPEGPYNPSNAASPCCNNWVDRSGAYTLTITTPYNYKNTGEDEAFIYVKLVHQFPLIFTSSLYPTIGVTVISIARNHAIPYAIFAFKQNDDHDISTNGATGITANKRVGDNGSVTMPNKSMLFVCNPQFGGDLWEYTATSSAAIDPTSIGEGNCPGGASSADKALGGYVFPPNVNLPPDPGSGALQGAITVPLGSTEMLIPTRSLDPTQPLGPRYSSVTVKGTLVLQPGVYFFEGTANGSGLNVAANGTVETGDCYLQVLPTCDPVVAKTNACLPAPGAPIASAVPGWASNFHCTTDFDFGALLVFWPAGPDVNAKCTNVNPAASGNYFCTAGAGGGGTYNTMNVQGGANFYLSSTPKFHDVSLFVDPNHATSSWNFTNSANLPASCSTQVCAKELGLGSNVIGVGGGGNISVNGAMLAPQDNVSVGGSSTGKGYGQILAYTISLNGNVGITENYNPIALAYVPVLVQ
jgi:Putative Flp pilus-assembly TadE/G-like